MVKSFFNLLFVFSTFIYACEDNGNSMGPPLANDSLQLSEAFPSLNFTRLVDLQNANDSYLYAVEQPGVIQIFENDPAVSESTVFLDIQDRVNDRDNEQGLLGLAFHPDYKDNGYFFVNYTTNQSTTRIARFELDPSNPVMALPDSEVIFLEFDQPFGNHNGGQLAFGPDGYLYISVGDGGSADDPNGNGQNLRTFLGTALRININEVNGNLNYSIPADNPFKDNQEGFLEEIYAYGLRNPWRMSFDMETGVLYAADVGQLDFEEINILTRGGNYGWNIAEGVDCFQNSACDQTNLKAPYFQYEHNNNNLSVTGGYVYRGSIAALQGFYIYGDYISGRIWALSTTAASPSNSLLLDTNISISSFGIDQNQELYVCSLNGTIYRFSN